MTKFKVVIEGDNFLLNLNSKVGKHGFFTTRFVEAKDSVNAETIAMNLIRDELKPTVLNDRSDPPIMYIENIHEIDDFEDNIAPGTGFTWFKSK